MNDFNYYYTVSEVISKIRNLIACEDTFQGISIKGEISNLRIQQTSGHIYFTLKDKNAQLKAVMFKRYAVGINFKLEEGVEVIANGSIDVYEKQGEIQLVVENLLPVGKGSLYVSFLQLKEKLLKEGLFEKKRPLPLYPKKIALITSPNAAAFQDVIKIIKRRYPMVELTLIPCLVQGEEASSSINKALDEAYKKGYFNLIMLVRGGGTIEDLWCFNNEFVARKMFESPIPIITGIGHETDFTIADFVADVRAPTPSAAAEIAVPSSEELKEKISKLNLSILKSLKNKLNISKLKLSSLLNTGKMRNPMDIVFQRKQEIDNLSNRLISNINYRKKFNSEKLKNILLRLKSLSPKSILSRGYSICKNKVTNKIIKGLNDLLIGDIIETIIADGKFESKVILK